MSKAIIAIAICLSIAASGTLIPNKTQQITLKNASNGILGYIDGGSGMKAVRNKSKQIIGYVDQNNTYDKNKKIIARSPLPGLLFCGIN